MSYRYYGQHGEDFLLWHFFNYRRDGYFLDIGAHDGIALSNTKSFEERGWRGICAEPVPPVFAAWPHTCQGRAGRLRRRN